MTQPRRKHRVLIVDDHPIVRDGLRSILDVEPELEVCGGASSVADAVDQLRALDPDLVVLDLHLEGESGMEILRRLPEVAPDTPALVLSVHRDAVYAERALSEGARGYVTKAQASEQLVAAVQAVLAGDVYVGEPLSTELLERLVRRPGEGSGLADRLTPRELQVFELLGRGRRTSEIADELEISVKTVQTHMRNVREKLGLRDSQALTFKAFRWVAAGRGS